MGNKTPLQQAVEIICDEVKAERIYLMNSMDHGDQNYFAFTTNMFGAYVYKLVVIVKGTRKPYSTIRANIKNRYKGPTPIEVMAIPIKHFRRGLDRKSRFEVRLQETACLLYDANDPRQEPEEPIQSDKWLVNMQDDIALYFNIGIDFINAADAHLHMKALRLAAFCLHQAMEYFTSSMMLIMTGYRATIHNMNELHRFSQSFLPEMSVIMPHHHQRQIRIQKILHRAYTSDDKPILEAELHAIYADLRNVLKIIRGIVEAKRG